MAGRVEPRLFVATINLFVKKADWLDIETIIKTISALSEFTDEDQEIGFRCLLGLAKKANLKTQTFRSQDS